MRRIHGGGRRGVPVLALMVLGLLATLTTGPARAATAGVVDVVGVEAAGLDAGEAAGHLIGRDPGVVYLTFDDGPDQLFTPILLDLLDRHGARATFFFLGRNLAARWGSDEVQDLLNRGHAVGNHSTHHRKLTEQPPWSVAADLEEASLLLANRTGFRPSCWRAPYGDLDEMVHSVAGSLDMTHVGWTADPQEWLNPWVPVVIDYLTGKRRDGAVVLLHDRKWLSLHIVDDLLPVFHDDGWRFDALPACRAPGEREARMATRGTDSTPVGRVDRVATVGGGLKVTGWAYDADAPGGGLDIRVSLGDPELEPPVWTASQTRSDHGFVVHLAEVADAPICVWAVDAGRRQDAVLGCHRHEIAPEG
ncbi:MAG: polysaccharide deacetylase family protein [Acidimicrobiaceae bacterium]|nr:polysaccharide deacetylase family protein [Acidimicrobiaceae bacterium]